MTTIAIKGHATRGKEVIQLLEMLDGVNYYNLKGSVDSYFYYIDESNKIYSCWDPNVKNVIIYTLEEFEKKYPYKVGDDVITKSNNVYKIKEMMWNNKEIVYALGDGESNICWYNTAELQPYKEELTMKKKSKLIDIRPKLIGNECVHFPIPTDMKLEVKDGMCYLYRDCGKHKESKCLQELKEYLDNATTEQLEEDWKELEKFSKVGPVADEYVEQCKREGVNLQELERKLDEALEKETTESLNKWLDEENVNTNNLCTRCVYAVDNHCGLRGFTNDFNRLYCSAQNADKLPNGFELQPDGYFSWVDSKPTYPKNYKECCEVLGYSGNYNMILTTDIDCKLFNALYRLKVCRDAYWKIAGEQMGLDKPWEPDWNDVCDKYTIYIVYGNEIWRDKGQTINTLLAFPTEEMRDTFYENFKDLIEQCKELL